MYIKVFNIFMLFVFLILISESKYFNIYVVFELVDLVKVDSNKKI